MLRRFIERVLKVVLVSTSRGMHMIAKCLDLLFDAFKQKRKQIKERVSTRFAWRHFPFIY